MSIIASKRPDGWPTHAVMDLDDLDENGLPAVAVRCPDCGQIELWSEAEVADHGKCRSNPHPCWCQILFDETTQPDDKERQR